MSNNPIDKDKITENPGSLEYAHHVGSALIKPIDEGKQKGLSVSAMHAQTDMQMQQIKEQIELLAEQAKAIQDRVSISEQIYLAKCSFTPIINHVYHLYQKENLDTHLSMIAPQEWGNSKRANKFIATVKLLADHTWDILEKGNN